MPWSLTQSMGRGRRPGAPWIRLVVLLALAVVITVGVAAACAMWSAVSYQTDPPVNDADDADRVWWQAYRVDDSVDADTVRRGGGFGLEVVIMSGDRTPDERFTGTAGGASLFAAKPQTKLDRVVSVRAGWPWPALAGERWDLDVTLADGLPSVGLESRHIRVADEHVAAASIGRGASGKEMRLLPGRPVWGGLLLNTLVTLLGLGLVDGAMRSMRGRRRQRRGLCAACGYDRQGQAEGPCPECGTG